MLSGPNLFCGILRVKHTSSGESSGSFIEDCFPKGQVRSGRTHVQVPAQAQNIAK